MALSGKIHCFIGQSHSARVSGTSRMLRVLSVLDVNLLILLIFLPFVQILERLPAVPGMTTRLSTSEGSSVRVLVYSYSPMEKKFTIARVPDEKEKNENEGSERKQGSNPLVTTLSRIKEAASNTINSAKRDTASAPFDTSTVETVSLDQIQPSPSAKFYPMLEVLMFRAEEAASASKDLLQSGATDRLVDKTGEVIGATADKIQSLALGDSDCDNETVGEGSSKSSPIRQPLEKLSDLAKDQAPVAEKTLKEVFTMLKDEQLTDLLSTCQDRLKSLVDNTNIAETTNKALSATGIKISQRESVSESIKETRAIALKALDSLLNHEEIKKIDMTGLENAKQEVAKHFSIAFDSLSTVAKSDQGLNELFEGVSEKTSQWQQATGRLWQTRSASLFMEGVTRLHARAAGLIQQQAGSVLGEIGSQLTKSFTEGDAAVARLKSIELGDAVKTKLVEAIEVRSESMGGLDGIIAGALSTVDRAKDKTGNRLEESSNQLSGFLLNLQKNASNVTSDARETLLGALSSHNKYRDVVLVRLENVFCSLEQHFGDQWSPEQIAKLALGEGGTSKLLQPIAKRAMQQIDQQLTTAEGSVSDPTVQEVLQRVRKIVSGDMSISAIMDDLVGVLNDEKVVSAGETIVLHSEKVLDVIEGVSGNKAVEDALQIAKKAGITKDSVMKEIQKLDVDQLMGAAGDAVTDEKARRQLISSATDTALDFALRIIPSMPVPAFEGVKDGLVYQISNLSMKGFKVRKEDIHIELAGMKATQKRREAEEGAIEDIDEGAMDIEEVHTTVKATELLIVDIQNISAVLNNAKWSFEQTYMPYLKGSGMADAKLTGGQIRLQFELRRRKRTNDDGVEVTEPVLCLHDRSCSIAQVELSLQGEGSLTWIFNKLAGIFKNALRDYVVRTIVKILTNRSGWLLKRLNGILSPYWQLILRTAKLEMVSLSGSAWLICACTYAI